MYCKGVFLKTVKIGNKLPMINTRFSLKKLPFFSQLLTWSSLQAVSQMFVPMVAPVYSTTLNMSPILAGAPNAFRYSTTTRSLIYNTKEMMSSQAFIHTHVILTIPTPYSCDTDCTLIPPM